MKVMVLIFIIEHFRFNITLLARTAPDRFIKNGAVNQ